MSNTTTTADADATTANGLTPQDYRFAVMSQSACNASGLVKSWSAVVDKIWHEARAHGGGTEFVNRHPIMQMYVTQLLWLTMGDTPNNYSVYHEAYKLCQERGAE